ncbi:MAG: hypothetical protein ACLGHN_02080 [Bacteriovoracia bacterium]
MNQIDSLIRGEISAVESIDQVLKKLDNEAEKGQLSSIRQDHLQAIDKLKRFSGSEFKSETQSSGPWGSFTQAFAGGASLFGDKAALKALKVGEEHGRNDYQDALKSGELNPEVRSLIESELLPQQEQHIRTIEGYLQ